MKILIASAVQEDQITAQDGAGQSEYRLGGAGLYAYAGVRVFTDDVQLLCNVEKGHLNKHRDWYQGNDIAVETVYECLEPGSVTKITYFADDTREDAPTDGLAEKRKRNPTIQQVEDACRQGISGLYMFRHLDEEYLWNIVKLSKRYGFLTQWEVAADALTPGNRGKIMELIRHMDIFSINMQEAKQLFQCDDEARITDLLRNSGCHCIFLRCGGKGAYMLSTEERVFCPSVPNCSVVDTTGAGNASTAAVLYGICRGESLYKAGIRGSVAASYIIKQPGPPVRFDADMHAEAERLVQTLCVE